MCQKELREVRYKEITIDRCACGGAWFDAGELEKYRSTVSEPIEESQLGTKVPLERGPTPRHCPRCKSASLLRGRTSKLRFLRCEECHGFFVPRQNLVSRLEDRSEGKVPFLLDILFVLALGNLDLP
jgi:Zn-finger nucleic acid-binding protein